MKRSTTIFINGIRSRPDASNEWTDRAVTWMERHGLMADKYEYHSFAVTRFLWQSYHAAEVARMIDDSRERKILVGHSNGCDIILRALAMSRATVEAAVLIAGACDERFDHNGLNDLMGRNRVMDCHVWYSEQDRALRAARQFTGWMRSFGMGYGWLGLVGPQRVSHVAEPWVERKEHWGYDHSTYFDADHFEGTMNQIRAIAREAQR